MAKFLRYLRKLLWPAPPVDWSTGRSKFAPDPSTPEDYMPAGELTGPPLPKPQRLRKVRQIDGRFDRHLDITTEHRGSLHITRAPRLRVLPKGLNVAGDLTIGGDEGNGTPEERRVPLKALPEGLRVGRVLRLRHLFLLERLPADFVVGGGIELIDCDSLRELPTGLTVNGPLTIVGGRSFFSLPVELHVRGDFKLSGTRVTELPRGLRVDGSLILEGRSRVNSIPDDLSVGVDLILRRCPIERLPAGLRLRRDLRVQGAKKLRELPVGLVVPGKLDLEECTALERLPSDLRVGSGLKLRRCTELRELPAGLRVPGVLDLRGCTALAALPSGLKIGFALAPQDTSESVRGSRRSYTPALRLADCAALTELPNHLQIFGPIDVANSGLTDMPPALADCPILWRGVLVLPDVVFHPERLVSQAVLEEPNAELRRVIMERLGIDRVLERVGAVVLDTDTDAGGPRRLVRISQLGHVYLHCRCPSTGRQYLLRVPPQTRTCRHAAAWMAGFNNPEQYRPVLET